MDKKKYQIDESTYLVDLEAMYYYLKDRIIKILLVAIIFAVGIGAITYFLIPKEYASSARVFVEPKMTDDGEISGSLTNNDKMVQNYLVMLEGNTIQTKAANEMNVKVEEINEALEITVVGDSQIINIQATTTDSQLSKEIAETVMGVFIEEVQNNLHVTNISVVDEPVRSKDPVSPSLVKNTAIGGFAGLMLMCVIYIIMFLKDQHIHNSDEATNFLGVPNFGVIADRKL